MVLMIPSNRASRNRSECYRFYFAPMQQSRLSSTTYSCNPVLRTFRSPHFPAHAKTNPLKNHFLRGSSSSRRLPIFTRRFQRTILGTSELNYCVRNGNRWDLTVIVTDHMTGSVYHKVYCLSSVFRRTCLQN